jgi:EmrB/QacA subfamily drug resistance transporter
MAAKKSRLGFVIAGLLLGILVSSMDNTIVATAMGTIVSELGGLDKFVWVTSAYMVTEIAGMPIFGKLSDMYGRKRFFLFGLIVFLIGSTLCGTAQSIVQLSIYRAIQGIGSGALIPIAFTIMFDVVPADQRGKIGGLFGAVFGLSSIFGPLLGAYLTDYISWHWIFYVNVPLGLIALALVACFYRETIRHAKQKIDWLGVMTLVPAIVCLMFALELGGHQFSWDSDVIIGLLAAFAILFLVFLAVESRAEEPIVSYQMFRKRLFAISNLVAFFSGAGFIAATVYLPIFVQGVMGGTAAHSGMVLLPMMLSSVVSSQLGAVLSSKLGYRRVMVAFSLIFLSGILLLGTLSSGTSRAVVTLYMVVTGLGVGASFSVLGMAAIHHFDATQRGSANSTLSFLRTLGMTLGITVFGVIQRNLFGGRLEDALAGSGQSPVNAEMLSDPHVLLSPATRASIPTPVLEQVTAALSDSIAHTFLWALIPAGLAFVFALLMGSERLEAAGRTRAAGDPSAGPLTAKDI